MIFVAKIGIFCKSIADQLASTPEPIELCMASYPALYAKFISMMSPKCSIVKNDGELMLIVLHAHFLSLQQYSRVYALFLLFTLWFIDEDASLFHFFHKIMNIRSWRCFSSSKIRKQYSHTFCNISMIFKVMSHFFPMLFKRTHNHIGSREGKSNYLSN